jgi:hypothetical protein
MNKCLVLLVLLASPAAMAQEDRPIVEPGTAADLGQRLPAPMRREPAVLTAPAVWPGPTSCHLSRRWYRWISPAGEAKARADRRKAA